MWILMVEAGVALCLLVFIVWWTMFSGRKEPPAPQRELDRPAPPHVPTSGPDQPPGA
jgi:hypothetical protein